MLIGLGSDKNVLSADEVSKILADVFRSLPLQNKRVLVIIPDGTRTAPIHLLFRLLYQEMGEQVAKLDYLIALGTHPPMSEAAIDQLVGLNANERADQYPKSHIFNHQWNQHEALKTIGTISREEVAHITTGLLDKEIPVTLNRLALDYDLVLICGPVFPHEVAGFSGGAKYLFPGIAGKEIIDATHWLGALATSMHTIGVKDTPVRRIIHRAAEFLEPPLLCLALVMQGKNLHGLYAGNHLEAFQAAADLSARLNIIQLARPFHKVLSMPGSQYDDLWTAAKAMYKTEPIIEDGGEVIIYAPQITEFSYTHGPLIEQVGYHVRDYFLAQWSRFQQVPGSILAHSTHVRGTGTYEPDTGIEQARIRVTLATGISEERCHHANLGYLDHRAIAPHAWTNREEEGILLIPHAGEVLYRLADSF